MDQIHKQVLANMTTIIMNRISSPTVFAAYLRTIFVSSDMEEIKAKEAQMGAIQGAQTLLSLLEKRGPKAFAMFKDALRNPGNNMADLADELEAEEERLRGKTGKKPFSICLTCDKSNLKTSITSNVFHVNCCHAMLWCKFKFRRCFSISHVNSWLISPILDVILTNWKISYGPSALEPNFPQLYDIFPSFRSRIPSPLGCPLPAHVFNLPWATRHITL